MINADEVIRRAKEEIEGEETRKAIDKAKETLRAHVPLTFWQRIFPWKIIIKRR